MAFRSMIPWRRGESRLPVRRERDEDEIFTLRNQMNRLFDEFFERPFGLTPFTGETALGDFAPQLDVSETDKEITVEAELPGIDPDDIDISLDRNMLTISGEKRIEKEEQDKEKRYYRVERSYGSFSRSIPLPEEVNEDKIDATFKNGVLKVHLPKTTEAQKKAKRISVKKG